MDFNFVYRFRKYAKFFAMNLLICIFPLYSNLFALDIFQAQTSKELQDRQGLTSFIHKADSSDTIRVAYLGGSNTEVPGWKVYSFDWLKERFFNIHFVQISAAIGGTGSDFAAYRLQEQLLSKMLIWSLYNLRSMTKENLRIRSFRPWKG